MTPMSDPTREALEQIASLPAVVPDHPHGGVHPPYLEWAKVAAIALAALATTPAPLDEPVENLVAHHLDNDVMRGVIALALYRAGIRGGGKDGLPWIVAEGVQVALVTSLRHAANARAALEGAPHD